MRAASSSGVATAWSALHTARRLSLASSPRRSSASRATPSRAACRWRPSESQAAARVLRIPRAMEGEAESTSASGRSRSASRASPLASTSSARRAARSLCWAADAPLQSPPASRARASSGRDPAMSAWAAFRVKCHAASPCASSARRWNSAAASRNRPSAKRSRAAESASPSGRGGASTHAPRRLARRSPAARGRRRIMGVGAIVAAHGRRPGRRPRAVSGRAARPCDGPGHET